MILVAGEDGGGEGSGGWGEGHAGGGMRGREAGVGGVCALDVYCGKRCVLSADLNEVSVGF
jgi:hypothetical protein